MRKIVSIILLIILSITISGCGGDSQSGKQSYSDPVYVVKILEDVQSADMIDTFAKYGKQYFIFIHPDSVYAEFYYEGDMDSLDQVNGDMQLIYYGTDTSSLLNPPVKLIAQYTSSDRHVSYFVDNSGKKPKDSTTPITSARFSELVEKLRGYLGNLGISSGYIEIAEYAVDGYWMVYHLPGKDKKADVELKIDSVTLELLEYNPNP